MRFQVPYPPMLKPVIYFLCSSILFLCKSKTSCNKAFSVLGIHQPSGHWGEITIAFFNCGNLWISFGGPWTFTLFRSLPLSPAPCKNKSKGHPFSSGSPSGILKRYFSFCPLTASFISSLVCLASRDEEKHIIKNNKIFFISHNWHNRYDINKQ